jgi:hypothetical protein
MSGLSLTAIAGRRHPRAVVSVCVIATWILAGCASPPRDAPAAPTEADFAGWDCSRIDLELARGQHRAADLAFPRGERAGTQIAALGVGLTVHWPTLMGLRPSGLDGAELRRLRQRDVVLRSAAAERDCSPVHRSQPLRDEAAAATAPVVVQAGPVAPGVRLVYEDRVDPRQPSVPWVLRFEAVDGELLRFSVEPGALPGGAWYQDAAGNITRAPEGALVWARLLREGLALGQVVAGEMQIVGKPMARARLRGQVVAIGPQLVADQRFDAAVIELFGDTGRGDDFARVDGAIMVDRHSGLLLRLDLRSAQPSFALQRRLMRLESVAP